MNMRYVTYRVCFVALIGLCLNPTAHAAEVLVKPIQRSGWSLYSEMDKNWDGWGGFTGVPADDSATIAALADRRPRSRAPGFRTASSGSHVFAVGFANPLTVDDDGFISKLDPAGSVVWTKLFNEFMGSSGWSPMDVKVMADRVYVCGLLDQGSPSRGFVAKLTLDGSLEDYTLFTPSGTTPFARATSLAVSSYGGAPSIVVVGDAKGDLIKVQQRQRLAAADVYAGLKLYKDGSTARSDTFIVRLDANLSATWATTMGFPRGDDYANAVTADNDGNIYLAINFHPNVDYSGNNSRIHEVDDHGGSGRPVYSGSSQANLTELADGITDVDIHYDFAQGYWGMLMKIDSQSGTGARIRRLFLPCKVEIGEDGSSNHISDLAYYDGSVYVAGEWRRRLRPQMERLESAFFLESLNTGSAQGYDAYVARLDASTLNADGWRFFQSSGEDFIHEMTVDAGGVYIAGTAGGSLDSFKNYGPENQLIDRTNASAEKVTLGGSTSYHLFWQKLNLSTLNLAANSHLTPVEDAGANISIPSGQRNAGIAIVGETAVFVGGRDGGSVTFGPVGKRKTLGAAGWSGYAGYLKSADFTFLEEVKVAINSAYGSPVPHRGVDTVAAGQTINASVPPEIYEAPGGAIIDPQDSEGIRTRAVTRRVCTGYQFRNSTVNGTANTVTFVASGDTELTFLWRTEHAVEIESDLVGTDGLTSTAAGNPSPAVQKHWIRENEQFTAFIDGAEADPAVPGVRWRSTGFVAEGCVAEAQQVTGGSLIRWNYQPRQQTAKITVASPGRITYRWKKELSLRVAVNSTVAESAPATYSDWMPPTTPPVPAAWGLWKFEFPVPVEVTRVVVRTRADWAANKPPDLALYASDNYWIMHTTPTGSISPQSLVTLQRTANSTFQRVWYVGGLTSGFITDPYIDLAEVLAVGFEASGPPASHVAQGTGEFWFPVDARVTVSSPASVSSGISSLALKGYTGGQGAAKPFDTRNVTSKSFVLNAPSSITWDYARAIYPETIIIGQPITFSGVTGVDASNVNKLKKPSGGSVSQGPSESAWGDMQQWDEVAQKLYAVRPGKFTVEFENSAKPEDPAQNVIVEVNAQWPTDAAYTHILEAPPVDLDPADTDGAAFQRLAFTEGGGQVSGELFSSSEPGRSVLVFSERSGGPATGNLAQERLSVRVVNTLRWSSSAIASNAFSLPATIGEAITSADHNVASVGHNGYVINPLAPVNSVIYSPETRQGPIIPVNESLPLIGSWAVSSSSTATRVLAGRIVEFTGPDGLLLDPSKFKVASSLYGNSNRTVNGVEFKTDGTGATANAVTANGVTITTTAQTPINDYAAAPTFTGGTAGSAANLAEIMRDIRYSAAPNAVQVKLTGLQAGRLYNIQLLTNEGSGHNRAFDISANGTLLVDNYTSSGHSAGRRWAANNSYAYAVELAAPANGEILLRLANDLGGNPAPPGTDNNPILNAVAVHELSGPVDSSILPDTVPSGLAIAWYKVQDGIRWPYKAARYVPQWPASPNRIVVASQVGSEGLNNAAGPPEQWFSGSLGAGDSLWQPPTLDRLSISPVAVPHVVIQLRTVAADTHWIYSDTGRHLFFVYENGFDPARPLENLVAAASPAAGNGGNMTYFRNVPGGALYTLVIVAKTPGEPAAGNFQQLLVGTARRIPLSPVYYGPAFSEPVIYHQADPTAMGYNPNEEHALIAPSFLNGTRSAAFALHSDLNRAAFDTNFTSKPYTLVQYLDKTDPANPVPKMLVYAVSEEDAATIDARLPPYNQKYTYLYQGEAGQRLVPPYPLDRVIGPSAMPEETEGENMGGRLAYHEDKKNMPWIISGDTDVAEDIRAAFYYPLRADFWHPTKETGQVVPLGQLTVARPRNIWYNTVWPADVAVLKAGETLTFAGGEYATDNSDATPRPKGLPAAAAWKSAKLLFDSANPGMEGAFMGSKYLARAFPALEPREAPLALTALPDDLKPASGNIIVEGLHWRFKKLPASLQKRVYFDSSKQALVVRGLLNDRPIGDGDLLASPGAQTILQPNVLTAADEAILVALSSASAWTTAATSLANLSRNPKGATVTGSLGIGLAPDGAGAKSATSFGPGLAVVTNADLLNPATAATLPEGYVTIAENDDESLGDLPVAMHVMKISRAKYRGSLAVLAPDNVFDEKVTVRHTADFGGDVADLFFEWIYREEDGRDLNPPGVTLPTAGTPSASDWTVFAGGGAGKNEIQLAGTGATLITDNLFFCRYRHVSDTAGANWSAWGGAANSREPKPSSPSAATDAAYVAQLVAGWVKRVAAAVNQFDARFSDFRNNTAPATYTSMIQQAGPRWEGPVAFNPDKDAVENVGLIELYQTVLDRAKDFTINVSSGSDGVNTALLNAANRIAGLYTMLGNEAYADAQDPTIGYTTVGGQFGQLASALHSFQNQTANLLDEELALLRGRGEVGARPAYNRLMWNFTNGPGEAAYVMNYGITDLSKDGFLDDKDARRLYPQGHGDAWGHYTMALRGYYGLLTLNNFTWSPRSEKYNIDGIVLDIDYLDERAFAKTAAAKAQAGAELVDLVYRQAYTENPNGQWQGYQDTNTDRAWGVFETAQRCGTAALCDWLTANAILPASDTSKTGIRRVDRTTVGELALIASQGAAIQAKLDSADRGLNPQGLDPNAVPFDIDPVLTDRGNTKAATHFEQVYDRAVAASQNALRVFDHANEVGLQLRRTADSTEKLRQQTMEQDRALRNQLIEIFGTPYDGQIGSGKAYPSGYNGPDLYLFMYMDQTSAGGDILPGLDNDLMKVSITPGLRNLANDNNAAMPGGGTVADALKDTVSKYFPADIVTPETTETITLNLPRLANSYALVAPSEWGQRRSPGAIQASIQELIQAEWKMRAAVDAYEGTKDDFITLLRKFELKSGIGAEKIRIAQYGFDQQKKWNNVATVAYSISNVLDQIRSVAIPLGDALAEALPKEVGLSNDATSAARSLFKIVGIGVHGGLSAAISPLEITQYRAEIESGEATAEMDRALLTEDIKSELVDILAEIQQLTNDEVDLRVAVIDAMEAVRAASERVRTVTQQGLALIDERTAFNQRVAATTTQQRYEDYTFRVTRNDALSKYRSAFDLAARHAYLAGKAYQYELNLPDNHAANATPLLADMLRTRTLGVWQNGQPVLANGGLAEKLNVLKTNFEHFKGQLGFNNPATEVNSFSLRSELFRIGLSSRVNNTWRSKLEEFRVPDLWNYQYQNNGVNYGYVFRRYCRPFAPEAAGPQPALVIPFSSQIAAGKNWFNQALAGGDSAFNASNFSTKIRAVGVRFDGYNNLVMSQTPQVYLMPVGADRMFLPDSLSLADRTWNVVDQRIPAPLSITASNLNDPNWLPFTGSANGFFEEIRKFSSFRAYHDAGGWSNGDMLSTGRLVGRSVWNTQWVLIIPSAAILSEPADADAGLDTFIYGAPLPGYTAATAGTQNRDLAGARDIRLLLQTYAISGN